MEITYKKIGDYYIPNIGLPETSDETPLGMYGRMRRTYLKEHRPILWNQMILQGALFQHLYEIDHIAYERLDRIIPELAAKAGATEALKARDPMKWVGIMNNCKAQAEEIVLSELIYV